ncbi:P12 [Clanis bilineata nucleopolyhedrovirus]|uniref:p12 n=1 Tax=Clanis bilineata nucleopolyhedrovirus TaxID=1307957 RepID=Q0N414_9ABAC|nr:P12 [Clanis bilineata nucleopolyhedrovirus]ABF47429.1 P12 [Clanis bilineata nucleopolyhedrovirus]
MSDAGLIETINATLNIDEDRRGRKRKRSRTRDVSFDPVTNINEPATMVNTLNEYTNSLATLILNDESAKKRVSFEVLSKSSAAAKNIFKDIVDDRDAVRLNTLRAVSVLRLLSNIYDNNF